MGRVLRTALATEDLVEIFTEAAGYSPAALAERRRQFERAFELLSDNPALGPRRLPAFPDVRVFPVERYLVFYRILRAGDGIDLLRIRPAATDWTEALDLGWP